MKRSLKSFTPQVLLALLAVVSLPVVGFARQGGGRTIKKYTWKNEPVKIVKVEVKGAPVGLDQKFAAGDDWLDGLTFRIRNMSHKPIVHIGLEMRFSKFDPASTEHPGVIIPLSYGGTTPYAERLARTDLPSPRPPLQPGETVELTFGSMEMLTLNAAQARFGIPTNIEAIQVTIQRVIFDDDEMWSTGEPMYRDPKNPDRWIPKSYKLDHPTVGNRF